MAEAFRMFDSSENEGDFEGFLIDETVKKTQPYALGASAITWPVIAVDSDGKEKDFFGFLDFEVEEIKSGTIAGMIAR